MTDTLPSDWHIQEAINRTNWVGYSSPPSVEQAKKRPSYYNLTLAHARTLAEFLPAPEPEPLDPYVEAAAQVTEAYGWSQTAKNIREGVPNFVDKTLIAKLRELFPHYGDTRTDLEIAREALVQMFDPDGRSEWVRITREGRHDRLEVLQVAALAIRMARGEA